MKLKTILLLRSSDAVHHLFGAEAKQNGPNTTTNRNIPTPLLTNEHVVLCVCAAE